VASEGEHGEDDECFGGLEPVGDAGEHPDLGVGGSMSPWERPWSRGASMAARCLTALRKFTGRRG
jgi:hypothetical protein